MLKAEIDKLKSDLEQIRSENIIAHQNYSEERNKANQFIENDKQECKNQKQNFLSKLESKDS